MKTVEELNSKYSGYSTSQLKIFLIALLGDYTDPKTIKLRKDQINKGMHENVFEDYDIEIKSWITSPKDDSVICPYCSNEHYLGSYREYAADFCPKCGKRVKL